GASKAALRHLSRVWNEELLAEGVSFLSLDPGDMDTPRHALAVPDSDPATLKRPETAARELAEAIAAALSARSLGKASRGAAAVAAVRVGRSPCVGTPFGHGGEDARSPASRIAALRGHARRDPGGLGASRRADPVRAHAGAARAVGRMDADCRPAGRLRAAVS